MTTAKSPRIELNPSKTQRMDFDSFAAMNLPGIRAEHLRLAFKLIWIAHRIYPLTYNQKGLRISHYIHLKEDIEAKLSKERGEKVTINLPNATIKKALKHMRKAGFIRYLPLEDRWYFSRKASGTLRKLADAIDEYQRPPLDPKKQIHDFCFDL